MTNHWTSFVFAGTHYVALVDEADRVIRSHPIGFSDEREVNRAVARLNASGRQ